MTTTLGLGRELTDSMGIRDLPAQWHTQADALERYGAAGNAIALRAAADQLEAALRAADGDVLTIAEAAAASGFSRDHLGRLLRAGAIPNVGRPHAPRVRKSDLPRKANRCLPSGDADGSLIDVRRRMAATVVHSQSGD